MFTCAFNSVFVNWQAYWREHYILHFISYKPGFLWCWNQACPPQPPGLLFTPIWQPLALIKQLTDQPRNLKKWHRETRCHPQVLSPYCLPLLSFLSKAAIPSFPIIITCPHPSTSLPTHLFWLMSPSWFLERDFLSSSDHQNWACLML